ncbi:MAG: hypothetical protein QOF64_3075 [Candidatus Binatota bacterium]|nr:hypothetical protein [Candidatus Binatota bacterium]
MGEEKEILLRGKVCAYLTDRLMGDTLPLLFSLPLVLEPSNSRSKGTSLFCEKNFLLSLFSFSHRR